MCEHTCLCSARFGPAFIGNVIGGVALVAAINHAQVISGKANSKI
jgi:hypothetical protein